ncbi:hypothetical protein [Paraflavitalea speifideaquila]|uniref:hypothetical protein n=1 Tax=Paraflavitalea speifideaquila TaxID=3076558 RepID=UPI0028E46255|nr:hypothetical protein [Paraflavitalea speifideiaquila]
MKRIGIGGLIQRRALTQFHSIFTAQKYPTRLVADAIEISVPRMRRAIENPGLLNADQIISIADYFQVTPTEMFQLIANQKKEMELL